MHPHFTRSRATPRSGDYANSPSALPSPADAGATHGSGTTPFSGPQQAQHPSLQANPLTSAGGHDHTSTPVLSVSRPLPYDRHTPLPAEMFSSEGSNHDHQQGATQTLPFTMTDGTGASEDSLLYRPYAEAQLRANHEAPEQSEAWSPNQQPEPSIQQQLVPVPVPVKSSQKATS